MVRVQEHENIQNQNLQGSHCNIYIYIYIDAKVVVELVQSETTPNASIPLCWLIASLFWAGFSIAICKVQHVFREANRVADALAKLGCHMQENFVIMDSFPYDVVSNFVYLDAMGENFCRLTASNLAILA